MLHALLQALCLAAVDVCMISVRRVYFLWTGNLSRVPPRARDLGPHPVFALSDATPLILLCPYHLPTQAWYSAFPSGVCELCVCCGADVKARAQVSSCRVGTGSRAWVANTLTR